jgi:arabinose-5-phosphate isomerase
MTLSLVPRERRELEADEAILATAREALSTQALALGRVASRLDAQFCRALDRILECRGRVIVCGMGKSGLIGRKLAATFSCSGTPSSFLHAAEASHGDLGMVTADDVMMLVSNSGHTDEVRWLLPYFAELGVPIISLVGDPASPVARAADVLLDVSVDQEMCPHNLMATTSALATLAIGDALAVAAMRKREFSAEDFARFHPGGALGRRLNRRVGDVMKSRELPVASPDVSVREALLTMSAGRCGLVVFVNETRNPVGIITDGDLRRGLQASADLLALPAAGVMTPSPVTIREDASVQEATERMHRLRIKALVVVDAGNRVVGVVDIFDD